MANQPFDTNILRALERPSASDLNALQAQLYRTIRHLDRLRFGYDLTSVYSGFLGYSFFVQNLTGLMQLNMSQGVGYQEDATSSVTNIDGIAGLNDLNTYKPIFMSSAKAVVVPSVLTTGKCRRDLIAVRWLRETDDPQSLDIFDPGSKTFTSEIHDKILSTDLSGKPVVFLEPGEAPSADAYIIYKKGAEITYVNDSSFLSAPLPSLDLGFMAVASINVKHGDLSIPNSRIADLRKLLGDGRQFTISGSATIGTNNDGTQYLDDVAITAPVGVRCCLSKFNQYAQDNGSTSYFNQQYQLTFFGPRVSVFEPTFTMWQSPTNGATDTYPWPTSATISDRNISSTFVTATDLADMVRSSTYTSPTVQAAVGQPCAFVRFVINAALERSIPPGGSLRYVNDTGFSDFAAEGDIFERTRKVSFVVIGQYAS